MATWFRWIKDKYEDLHISESFRNEVNQNQDVLTGKSKLKWPLSRHNHMEGGKPASLALDVFRLNGDGVAKFERSYYQELINDTINRLQFSYIRWGGNYHGFPDLPHFETLLADIPKAP